MADGKTRIGLIGCGNIAGILAAHGNGILDIAACHDIDADRMRQYSERTQLGRMANDTDLKGIIVLLASDASAYITGTNIPVDGGYTAK